MAKSNNILTKGLSGMVGKQLVFRTWNGKTYISVAPRKPKKQSPLQKDNRQKFKMATLFAKRMMSEPATKEQYKTIAKKLKLPNAYTAAITEYMRKPELQQLDASQYTGKADQEIRVWTRKKGFEIKEVEVIIIGNSGEIIEEGKATQKPTSGWVYKTKAEVKEKDPVIFLVKIRDRAGNLTEKRFDKPMQ